MALAHCPASTAVAPGGWGLRSRRAGQVSSTTSATGWARPTERRLCLMASRAPFFFTRPASVYLLLSVFASVLLYE